MRRNPHLSNLGDAARGRNADDVSLDRPFLFFFPFSSLGLGLGRFSGFWVSFFDLPLNPNSKSENYGEVEIRLGEVFSRLV